MTRARKRTKPRQTRDRKPLRPSPFVRGIAVEDCDTGPELVTVNKVTLDNTVPGGFRNVAIPVQPGERV